MRKQRRVLQQQTDPPVVHRDVHARCRVGQPALAHRHGARVGPQETGNHVQHTGLPRAVGPDDGQHLAGGDLEIHIDAASLDDRAYRETARHCRLSASNGP